MSTVGMEKRRVKIVAEKPVQEAVAMWQNEEVEDVCVEGNIITVAVPAKAVNFERSVLRVFAASAEGRFNDVLLPLEYGVVASWGRIQLSFLPS